MSERNDQRLEQMRAVTISREYGSGGGEIAKRLAAQLGWQLIDHEIVSRVAQEMNISERDSQAHDEQPESALSRILNVMRDVDPPIMVAVPTPQGIITSAQMYRNALTKVVDAAVARGHVVIVGRAAQVLLAERRDVLHARVVAPLEMRITYVMKREGLERQQALERIQQKERDRQRYLHSEFKRHPDDAYLYDVIVNTAIIALDDIVNLLQGALHYKAAQLSTPTEELGPVACMTPYPGRPEDFPLPKTP